MDASFKISVAAIAVSVVSVAVSIVVATTQIRCDATVRITGCRKHSENIWELLIEVLADSRGDTRFISANGVGGAMLHPFRHESRVGAVAYGGVDLVLGEQATTLVLDKLVRRGSALSTRMFVSSPSHVAALAFTLRCERLPWRTTRTVVARFASNPTETAPRVNS